MQHSQEASHMAYIRGRIISTHGIMGRKKVTTDIETEKSLHHAATKTGKKCQDEREGVTGMGPSA